MKRALLTGAAFALLWTGSQICAAELDQERAEDRAGKLLFMLASGDHVIHQEKLDQILAREGSAMAELYGRLIDDLEKEGRREVALTKKPGDDRSFYRFKSRTIRMAAEEELVELGLPIEGVLLRALNSARQEIVLGVVHVLRRVGSRQVLPALSDVLERDKWGQSRFTDWVRRDAAEILTDQDPSEPHWKKILETHIDDLDPHMRHILREIAPKALSTDAPWVEGLLVLSLNLAKRTPQGDSTRTQGSFRRRSGEVVWSLENPRGDPRQNPQGLSRGPSRAPLHPGPFPPTSFQARRRPGPQGSPALPPSLPLPRR